MEIFLQQYIQKYEILMIVIIQIEKFELLAKNVKIPMFVN